MRRFTARFRRQRGLSAFEVSAEARRDAVARLDPQTRADTEFAIANVRAFAEAQRGTIGDLEVEIRPGVHLGHRNIPLARVGCYVPGGRYPLLSAPVMTIVPAKVAGVGEVVACLPPGAHEAMVAGCHLAGAEPHLPHRRPRRRSPRWRWAPRACRASTRSQAPATPTSTRPSARSSAPWASTSSRAPPRSSSSPTRRAMPRRSPPTCWRRPSTTCARASASSPRTAHWPHAVPHRGRGATRDARHGGRRPARLGGPRRDRAWSRDREAMRALLRRGRRRAPAGPCRGRGGLSPGR